MSFEIDFLKRNNAELLRENAALQRALETEKVHHQCAQEALDKLHCGDDERRIEKAQILLDEELEALNIWGKPLRPVFDAYIDTRPDLYLDYRRFNELLDGLTVDGGC